MKKLLMYIFIFISLIIPYNVYALSTIEAKEKIDVTKNCNLTLNYLYDNHTFNNIKVKLYHIASISSDFKYQLSSNFLEYPIKINGLKTNNEWNSLEQTLNAYIIADNIEKTSLYSITDNKVKISNLKPGLYFIKTEKIDNYNYTLQFNSFLINVPELNNNGTWNYNINVYPKAEEYIPKYKKINYTVVKEWIDNSRTRPNNINIEIYKDDKLINKQVLSSNNNWTYEWTTDDDGSIWTVVERNIPTNYNVSITKKNRNFIIINTNINYKENNPQTGDNIKLYFYLLIGTFIGLILLAINFILKNKHQDEK